MSKTSWLVAAIHEPLNRTYGLPPRPETVTVVAADGSQIMPSHHEVVPAFLLNIATVVLNYGSGGGRGRLPARQACFTVTRTCTWITVVSACR